jgi:hypothetical protein
MPAPLLDADAAEMKHARSRQLNTSEKEYEAGAFLLPTQTHAEVALCLPEFGWLLPPLSL